MLRKILKAFSLPLILSLLVVFYYFNVDQTLFTWIIEKILILVSILLYLLAFPLFLELHKNNTSLKEALLKVKERIFSFWATTFLTFSLFLAHLLLAIILWFFIPYILNYPYQAFFITLIATTLFSIIFIFFPCIKFLTAPFISYFEKKGARASLWKSAEMSGFWHKIVTLMLIIIPFLVTYYLSIFVTPPSLVYLIHPLFAILLFFALFWRYKKLRKEKIKPVKIWTKIISAPFLVVGVFSLILFFVFSFNVLFRDYDPPLMDDSEITFELTEAKKEGNLYFFLKEDHCDIYKDPVSFSKEEEEFVDEIKKIISSEDYYEFIKNNPEKAEEFIEMNHRYFDCFEKMTSMTHYTADSFEGKLKRDSLSIAELSRMNIFKATYLHYIGETKRAFEKILNTSRITSLLLENSNGPSINHISRVNTIQDIAFNAFRQLSKEELSKEYLMQYAKKLEKLESSPNIVKRGYKHKYMMKWNSFFDDSDKRTTFFYKPNKTKNLIIQTFMNIINEGSILDPDFSYIAEQRSYVVEERSYVGYGGGGNLLWILEGLFLTDNLEGRRIYYSSFSRWPMSFSFFSMMKYPRYIETRNRTTILQNRLSRLSLLLIVYEKEKGELPDSLEELVLKYNIENLKDPFFPEENIQYSKKERFLYSPYKEEAREEERAKHMINF